MKRFLMWINLKQRLHETEHHPPFVTEHEIWWASVGENVGSEINGKSNLFSRPVIIYRKLAHGFYLVLPTTTQPKAGSWYVPFRHNARDMVACLHQARTIDYRRLSSRIGKLDEDDFDRSEAFWRLYK